MKARKRTWSGIILTAGLLMLGLPAFTSAQGAPASGTPSSTAAPANKDAAKPGAATPLDTAPPVNTEEDTAFKAFQDAPSTDETKKIALGEAFDQKYPESRYRPLLYSALTLLYLRSNQLQKMEAVGDKEAQLTPTDVQTLALLGQTIPRSLNGVSGAEAVKELAKAEDYSKRAIEVTPTISKPPAISDEAFATAKATTLAMAHSGLGLIYVRRGKFEAAIPELDQSVKLDPIPDPVNYYLLGLANQKGSHFEDAIAAYDKCASIPGGMQPTCKSGSDEVKKLAKTELSVPK